MDADEVRKRVAKRQKRQAQEAGIGPWPQAAWVFILAVGLSFLIIYGVWEQDWNHR